MSADKTARKPDEPAWTKGPWKFERMESVEEFATLKGETLGDHEGYYRENNGDWIVTFRDLETDDGGRIAGVSFKGKAKRGETWRAPDPIGMANARLIAAAPDLYKALAKARREIVFQLRGNEALAKCNLTVMVIDAALARARGQ